MQIPIPPRLFPKEEKSSNFTTKKSTDNGNRKDGFLPYYCVTGLPLVQKAK